MILMIIISINQQLNISLFNMEIPKHKVSLKDKQLRKRTKEEYLRIFMEFDADSSGSVTKSEIVKMFKACGMEIDQQQAEDLINEIDADGGGELEQDEFIEFLKREDQTIQYSIEECKRMFQFFVDEETFTIGFEELKYMFASLGQKASDYEVSKMMLFADKNRDSRLDFQQFCKVIQQI